MKHRTVMIRRSAIIYDQTKDKRALNRKFHSTQTRMNMQKCFSDFCWMSSSALEVLALDLRKVQQQPVLSVNSCVRPTIQIRRQCITLRLFS